jgi:hypothetical protein
LIHPSFNHQTTGDEGGRLDFGSRLTPRFVFIGYAIALSVFRRNISIYLLFIGVVVT